MRMRDALSSTVLEELYGNQYAEWAWQPHDFHYQRLRAFRAYTHPDDPRVNFKCFLCFILIFFFSLDVWN